MSLADSPEIIRACSPGTGGIAALLAAAAALRQDAPFLVGESATLSYAETAGKVERLAAALAGRGLRHGDRMVIVCGNRIEAALLVFAAASLGVVFVLLSPQTKVEGYSRIVEQCQPGLVVLDKTYAVGAGAEQVAAPVLVLEEDFAGLLATDAAPAAFHGGIDQDPAFLVFTSGSTGVPRGVILSHANVLFVTRAILKRLGYQPEDRVGIFLPLSFDVGLYQLFLAAMSGASVYLGSPEMAGPLLARQLASKEVTVLPCVPTLIAALVRVQQARPTPLPKLRIITSTGDHLPRPYIEQILALSPGLRLFPMYGLTECKRVSILLPEELPDHPDSVGRALDGTEVFAVDAEGRRLPAGQPGELVVRGPHLALGYWRAPEETAQRYRVVGPGMSRWMFTGDQGRVDEQGYIYFMGRGDFLVKHRGFRLSPLEVEDAACRLKGVVAAGLVKHEGDGLLHLFLSTSEPLDAAQVIQELSQLLEPYKVPERVHFRADLPKTANQKVDRKALRAELSNPVA